MLCFQCIKHPRLLPGALKILLPINFRKEVAQLKARARLARNKKERMKGSAVWEKNFLVHLTDIPLTLGAAGQLGASGVGSVAVPEDESL